MYMRIVTIFLFFVLFGIPVHEVDASYLDPGNGSYLIQVIISLFLGLTFTFRVYWKRLHTIFQRLRKKNTEKE